MYDIPNSDPALYDVSEPAIKRLLSRMEPWTDHMNVVQRLLLLTVSLAVLGQLAPGANSAIIASATRFAPGFTWQSKSILTAEFDCSGRRQQAILGTNKTAIVILIFLDHIKSRPQILRYSGGARNPASAILTTESLDYDPKAELGSNLPGFRRSKTCSGLNLSDGQIDSAHIYWNREAHRFSDWTR